MTLTKAVSNIPQSITTPFFSVIIPTYNRDQLIERTINSVLAQSYVNFEIIVVDNKSTDNTVELLQPYVDNGAIRLFVQDKNYERACSRNKGFREAKGEFVTLLDSDDILYPACLEDAFKFYEANPGIKFFHSCYEVIDERGNIMARGKLKEIQNPFAELSRGNYISNIGVFIHRDIVERVKVDETPILIGMEDYDFVLRVLYAVKKIGFIDKINCGILVHPQRTVLTQDMDTITNRVNFFVSKSLDSELFRYDFYRYRKTFASSNQLYLCGAAAIRGLTAKAFKHLVKSAISNPTDIFTFKYWRHFFVILKYMFR